MIGQLHDGHLLAFMRVDYAGIRPAAPAVHALPAVQQHDLGRMEHVVRSAPQAHRLRGCGRVVGDGPHHVAITRMQPKQLACTGQGLGFG